GEGRIGDRPVPGAVAAAVAISGDRRVRRVDGHHLDLRWHEPQRKIIAVAGQDPGAQAETMRGDRGEEGRPTRPHVVAEVVEGDVTDGDEIGRGHRRLRVAGAWR